MARDGEAGRSRVHRVLQAMMVAQHHAQFGLPVVVVDGHPQFVGKPANHFRVQRLTGTADNAQAAFDRCREGIAGRDQQTVSGGRPGQVGDAQRFDHPHTAFDTERAIVEGGGMPQGQRPGDGVVQAIGPAGVGQVPEVVFAAQVDGIAHVALEGDDGTQRYFQRLGRAGGTGREHQQERVVARAHHGLAFRRGAGQALLEIQFATAGVHRDDRRAGVYIVQLAPVDAVCDNDTGAGLFKTVLDGLGPEGGEQGLVHRPDAPGGQDADQQLGGAWQQPRHPVARLHALRLEHIGEPGGQHVQLLEAVAGSVAIAIDMQQCHLAMA